MKSETPQPSSYKATIIKKKLYSDSKPPRAAMRSMGATREGFRDAREASANSTGSARSNFGP